MNSSRNILDAPVNGYEIPGLQPDYATVNKVDYIINVFLLAVAGLVGVSTLLIEEVYVFFLLIWNIAVGTYQLLSALVGAMRGNTKKLTYFIGAIVYLIIVFIVGIGAVSWFDTTGKEELIILFFIIFPLVGAVYYTLLCLAAKNRGQ